MVRADSRVYGGMVELQMEINSTNGILDQILRRIEKAEVQMGTVSLEEMKKDIQQIIGDLRALEPIIDRLVNQVNNLRIAQHPQAIFYNEQ